MELPVSFLYVIDSHPSDGSVCVPCLCPSHLPEHKEKRQDTSCGTSRSNKGNQTRKSVMKAELVLGNDGSKMILPLLSLLVVRFVHSFTRSVPSSVPLSFFLPNPSLLLGLFSRLLLLLSLTCLFSNSIAGRFSVHTGGKEEANITGQKTGSRRELRGD